MKRPRRQSGVLYGALGDECREGHALVDANIVWGTSRGRAFRRCRTCFNAYHRAKNKEIRRAGWATALKMLRDVAATPARFPRDLVADVLLLASEIRTKVEQGAAHPRGERRAFDFSKAVKNPFAAKLRARQ